MLIQFVTTIGAVMISSSTFSFWVELMLVAVHEGTTAKMEAGCP